jgi:tRNA(fMet)-specific endonuclease VapC
MTTLLGAVNSANVASRDRVVSFLLDTDICSAHLKGNRQVWQKIVQHGGQLRISTITLGELYTWAFRKSASSKRRQALQDFVRDVIVMEVTAAVGERCGALRAQYLDAGKAAP